LTLRRQTQQTLSHSLPLNGMKKHDKILIYDLGIDRKFISNWIKITRLISFEREL
jgi:hypothetical protein